MKQKYKYITIFLLSFILYGNTLFHDYALDDAMVITENHFTLNGFDGIKDIFTQEFFSGFFGQKDKKLVAGGRYRPLSMATFAIEWQLVMGSPFDGTNSVVLEKKLNRGSTSGFILPSQKLVKELSGTIHIQNKNTRFQKQKNILKEAAVFSKNDELKILSNLRKMHKKRSLLLFISHFINVLLYAFTCIILLKVLEKFFLNDYPGIKYLTFPFLITLLFLAHPIHTEVVANIKGRDEILSLLGALLATHFCFKYIDNKKMYFLVLSFLFFLMGVFSKEVAVTFIAVIPLSIYFFGKNKKTGKTYLLAILPALIASGIYFYARMKVLGGMSFEPGNELMNNSFFGMSVSEKYATIFYTLLLYIKLLVFPHPLTYDYYPYHIPVMNWGNIWPVLSLLLYLAIGIYALTGLKKRKLVSYGALFYLIALSPMSNIFFPIGVFMNERFVYTASIGFVIILAYLLVSKIPAWIKTGRNYIYIVLMILALYSFKTITRNRAWKDDFTLFTTDVKTSVNSAKSNTTAGGKLIEEAIKTENKNKKARYLNQSISYLRKAISIHPKYDDALLLMGNAQWELYHNIDSVFKYYELILKRNPMYGRVYSNIFHTKLSSVFDDAKQAGQNIEILHKLEKYNPSYFEINYNLGRIYGRFLNNLDKSLYYLEKAAQINPNEVSVFKDLGVAYGISGNYEKSAQALKKAVQLDTNDPVLRVNLAMTYANMKNYEEALKVMDNILKMKIQKKDIASLLNLANMYNNFGKPDKARLCIAKAKKINPDIQIK